MRLAKKKDENYSVVSSVKSMAKVMIRQYSFVVTFLATSIVIMGIDSLKGLSSAYP